LRLSVFRLRYFSFSFVARVERSETRGANRKGKISPGFRFAQSGLQVLRSGRSEDQGRHHHLSHFAFRLRAYVTVAWHSSDAQPHRENALSLRAKRSNPA
jgi:hypothetical protein